MTERERLVKEVTKWHEAMLFADDGGWYALSQMNLAENALATYDKTHPEVGADET